ncbi:HAD-IB family hydrolase [Helicobacter cappadocius]|uniref:HAD-IB family hydrolase n=1 Tax=Helicobacter cappadocius TaxID=3063998 RepID=A0AA90Q3I0_9HELI|nr:MULTISPECIES: HAD-IB family hydrolase [unclassified Helicobacter]MDO7253545.1 HAD-IB family hydrolase [Helicobacter sp. faydin-H75]MDP2539473.1 HAD-IB family hydrolase [Helicobacter sp. faydin-H76]
MKQNIAFFDFDGTITRRDSLFLFVKFLVGHRKFYWGILIHLHILLGYLMGVLKNSYAKERLSEYFFKGYEGKEFLIECEKFLTILKTTLKDSALERLYWHKQQGDKIVLVSASFEEYLIPLCRELQIDCIGTALEVKNAKLTGRFACANCYGKEKSIRIQNKYDLKDYAKIYAYGDSSGDKEMLALASIENRFYKFFK